MACNIGDFSRYSKKESSAWMQMLFVPALWCITSLFGAIASNMTLAIYGEILWQPFDIIDKWEGSHGGRLAAFVCAFGESRAAEFPWRVSSPNPTPPPS